jgi:hypothetical protein
VAHNQSDKRRKEDRMFRTNRTKLRLVFCFLLICSAISLMAQQASTADSVVPAVVKFTGTLNDADGKPLTGTQGVTFLLYNEQTGGAPLWMETQNVQADKGGRYTVMLGATTSHGLPADAFKGGEARWLAAQPHGQAEPARIFLASVPYAMKALDAETLGGRPASAFMSAPPSPARPGTARRQAGSQAEQPNEIVCSSATACKTGFVPVFGSNGGSAKVKDSILSQSGSTLTIGGSDAITGNESVSGSIRASGLITGGFVGATNGSGAAIVGTSHGTSGGSDGVDGVTTSGTASGVAGINQSGGIGLYGTGGTGVAGFAGGYGIYGQHVGASSLGSELPYAGIWGDTNTLGAAGVAGTGQDGVGGIFLNDSPQGYYSLIAASYASGAPMFTAENIANGVSCSINQNAHLQCDGGIGAMVQVDNGKRRLAMSGIESPENWFEDFGSAQLINGSAVIQLDSDFIQTVNTEKDYRVFPVPNGDCKGLYVANKSVNSFEVRELGGGSSNIRFDYRITAVRRNYETVRFADHTKDLDPKNMLEQMRKAKPASSPSPASLKPASQSAVGIPPAQLSKQ